MSRFPLRKFFFLFAAFPVFLTLSTSCKEDSINVDTGLDGRITIAPLLTRVTDTSFENGDRIGLMILIGDERFSENSPMEYSDGIFSGNLTWYENTGTSSEFFAYHPYNEAGIPTSFSVSSDQSDGPSDSDLIIGTKSNVKPTAESVQMTFRHVLSKITVKMTNRTGSDIKSLSFEGAKNIADVDIFTSRVSVSESSEAAGIKAFESEKNQYYTAIFIPQKVTLTLSVVTSDSKEYAIELEPMTLLQGKQYEVTARLSEERGLEVKVAGDVDDWEDGGEIGPGELPELEDVDDVCEKMDDLAFMSYCYKNFDVNGDGKVSMAEANAVKNIDCSSAVSFKGIEYFTNLETLKASSVESIDLGYNILLSELNLSGSALTELDLSRNTELSYIKFRCTALKKITFADKTRITKITSSDFSGCTSLEKVILPEGITNIGESSFESFKNLSYIDLPQSLTSIGSSAFYECSSLESIELPQSLTSIESFAFDGCSNLSSVTINSEHIDYKGNPFVECPCHFYGYGVSEDNLLIISGNKLVSASSLIQGHYTLPQNLTSIGSCAFYECWLLESIVLPQSLTSIGGSAFYGCTSLESIVLPQSLTSIGVYTFYGCSSLESIELPQSLTSIGGSAFYGCTSLKSIELPQSLTSIEGAAFYGCTSLRSIVLPESVTSIESNTFYECSSLETIYLPQSLTSIGGSAFDGCTSLKSIELPQKLTSIGSHAFAFCSSLESIDASKCFSLKSIDYEAFIRTPVKIFLLGAINPPSLSWDNHFDSELDAVLKVPAESIETYRNSDWAYYFTSIEALENM